MEGQLFDVLPPLAQRRADDGDDLQPVIEVLAELALFQELLQVFIRRRDNPDVHLDRHRPADAKHLAFLKDPQNFGLHGQAGVADFVQEQSRVVGPLEKAFLLLVRVGEGALLMAEEFALEQGFGKCRAVNGQERPVAPRAVTVDSARHQLFAGPAFTEDEHGVSCRGHLEDHPDHRLGGGRVSDDGLLERLQALEDLPDDFQQSVAVHRLFQILVNTLLGGLDRGLNGGITRNEDDGDGGVGGEDAAQKLDAGHPGQVEVGQDQIKAFLAQETQSGLAARRRLSVVAFVPQDVAVDFALAFLVVNHQDGLAGHERESLRGGWRCCRGQLGDRAAGKRKLDAHAGPAQGIGAGTPEPTGVSAGTADDTGSSITITVPGPSLASTRMLPLWSSTIFFVMASPRPRPVALVEK